MFKMRGGLLVILSTIIGIVLVIVALSAAQEAMQVTVVSKGELFTLSGKARFIERSDEQLWRPKKYIGVILQDYPAFFIISEKSKKQSASSFEKALDTTVQIAIPRDALGLLQTRTEIKLYELSSATGNVLYSFTDAIDRDKQERLWLYLQAGLCFVAGLVLLIFPKRYLVKQ